ncbi:MAG: restriction endonuclease subunit S [bacterium]
MFLKNNQLLSQFYLTQFVFSNLFSSQITKVLVAGAQPNISGKDIEEFIIRLPSLLEQYKIADFLTSIDKVIESKQQQVIQAELWKKGLMQELFV